jgi:hypothetical protein
VPAVADWNAIGAVAGVIAVVLVVGSAAGKTVATRIGRSRAGTRRIDLLEIRLFGLPADPNTGAKKLDGEFDRIDKRLDELPGQVIAALRNDA